MPRYYLALCTNGPIFRQEETIKILCRLVPLDQETVMLIPKIDFQLFRLEKDSQQKMEYPNALFLHPLFESLPGFFAARLSGEQLEPGAYVLRALDRHPGEDQGFRETGFFVMSPSIYENYWAEIAEEGFLDKEHIYTPGGILECIRTVKKRLADKLNISAVNLDLNFSDRLQEATFGIRKAPFEWFHYYLLLAAYDKVFYGGNISLTICLEQRHLTSKLLLTSRPGGIEGGLPPFLSYIRKGMPIPVKIGHKQHSEHQFEILYQHQYEDIHKSGYQHPPAERARPYTVVDRVLIGESLVGEGNEVAHVDLLMGPRGSAAEAAFCNALTNNKEGFTALLAIVAPNLPAKPNTILFNKVTIKGTKQAVQMFGPAQRAVAMAVTDCVESGIIPESEADDIFICVGVFIHWLAEDNNKIQAWNYQATKEAIERAVKRLPKAKEVISKKSMAHPFAAHI